MLNRQTALGVDIGDDTIRVVVLRAAGRAYEVVAAGCRPVPPTEAPAEVLAALLRELSVAPTRVAGALPASGCIIKTAELPPARPAELAQVARFEAETQFPLPLAEMAWQYTLSPSPNGRQHAVIAGARRTLAEEGVAVLQQAGLTPHLLLPAPLAAAETVAHPAGLHLLIIAGPLWSDLCLYHDEQFIACRSVRAGQPDDEEWAERMAREARPWLAAAEHPQAIVLLGDCAPAAIRALAGTTGLSINAANPWEGMRDPGGQLTALAGTPAAFATALGLARAALSASPGLNLLPSQVLDGYRQRRGQLRVLAALGVLCVLLAPVALQGHQRYQQARTAHSALAAQVAQARHALPKAPEAGVAAAQRTLSALEQPESRPLELLRLLSVKLPLRVTLASFAYDRGKGTVILKGRADKQTTIAAAMREINGLALVDQAVLDHATLVTEDDGKGYDFQITCQLPATDDPTTLAGKRRQRSTGIRVQ